MCWWGGGKSTVRGSNSPSAAYKTAATPLRPPVQSEVGWDRTSDAGLFRPALYRLSYDFIVGPASNDLATFRLRGGCSAS